MSQQFRRIVLITGFHGLPFGEVIRYMERHDYLSVWPDQDLDVVCYEAQGNWLYEHYRENIELLRLNEEILAQAGIRWDEVGEVMPEGVLSPEPLLNMFPPHKSVVLADPRLCLTLQAFSGSATDVIYIYPYDKLAHAAYMTEQWGWDDKHWLHQMDAYEKAFRSHRVKALEFSSSECNPYELMLRLAPLT